MNKQIKDLAKKYQRLLIVVATAIVIIVAMAIAHIRVTNLNSQSVANTQGSAITGSATTASNETSTPAPAPKSTAPTATQQVTAWYDKYGSSITALSNDFGQLSDEGTNSSAIEATCTQIFDDATKAEGEPSIPDTQAENDWSSALNSYVNGAQDCQDGVTNSDSTQISQATTDFDQGNSQLDLAAKRIEQLK